MARKQRDEVDEVQGTPLRAQSPEPTPVETPPPDVPTTDVPDDDDEQTEPVAVIDAANGTDTTPTVGGDAVQVLPILPLRGTVVFPLTVVPLAAAQARSLRLIDEVMSGDRTVGLVMQKNAELEGAGPNDVHSIGTIATIHQMMRVPDGSVRLAVQGVERMRILEFLGEEPFLTARVEKIPEQLAD